MNLGLGCDDASGVALSRSSRNNSNGEDLSGKVGVRDVTPYTRSPTEGIWGVEASRPNPASLLSSDEQYCPPLGFYSLISLSMLQNT